MTAQVITSTYMDGATLLAAATASCIPPFCKATIPAGYWQIGRVWRLTAAGRVSSIVTTPGTFRLGLYMSAVVVFDTQAIPLNVVAQTTVPWYMEVLITCRAVGTGTNANLFPQGFIDSTAFFNTVAVATGPWTGVIPVPYNLAPVAGTGFDSTIPNTLDFQFTQTVATGSFTLHSFCIEQLTP